MPLLPVTLMSVKPSPTNLPSDHVVARKLLKPAQRHSCRVAVTVAHGDRDLAWRHRLRAAAGRPG